MSNRSIWTIERALSGATWSGSPVRCYHSRSDWTWEQWQWRGTPSSPKLNHYWERIIRLFNVISWTLIGWWWVKSLQRWSWRILQPQPSRDSLPDCLRSYQDTRLLGCSPFAEMKSKYSTTPADWNLPSNSLISYPGHWLGEFYPSAEMQWMFLQTQSTENSPPDCLRSYQDTPCGGIPTLQRWSWCILQPQPAGASSSDCLMPYPVHPL